MTPIKFEDRDCENTYTTRVDKDKVTYVITVDQWRMSSKTRIVFFDTKTHYYQTEILILVDNNVIGRRKDFFTEPLRGKFTRTKLPHAVIAMAAFDKVSKVVAAA